MSTFFKCKGETNPPRIDDRESAVMIWHGKSSPNPRSDPKSFLLLEVSVSRSQPHQVYFTRGSTVRNSSSRAVPAGCCIRTMIIAPILYT